MKLVNMSLAPPFLLIKTGIIAILFSLSFVAAGAADDDDAGLLDNQLARLREDNIAPGNNELAEVIGDAPDKERQFVSGGGGSQPEAANAQKGPKAIDDGGGRSWLQSGSSFNFNNQARENDDGSISASLNKRSTTTSSTGFGAVFASNPLIESATDTSNTAANAFDHFQRIRRARRHRPFGSGDQNDGHKYHWCHRDCKSIKHSTTVAPVCASDGRLYGSICELQRHSCHYNVHLFKRPASHCAAQMSRNASLPGVGGDNDERTRLARSNEASPVKLAANEVKIVELKGRCNRVELEAMKLLLLGHFGGDIEKIFKYFDSNDDQFIEAHELWPKRDAANTKSLYAQAWDEHSNKCQANYSGLRYHINGDRSKCWFFLDFAFEPQYPSNPCSLSHLILFDLKHPNSRFSFDTFQKALQNALLLYNDSIASRSKEQVNIIKRKTRAYIVLGATVELSCFLNSTNWLLEKGNLIEENDAGNGLHLDGSKCSWTRYNLNMAAKIDPHISIQKRYIFAENKKKSYDLNLHIKDAQLYLSGQFKCSCSLDGIERIFEHAYDVQVLAEPRVSVRPQFQWSLPHSRISFECQYDHIDTSFKDDRESPTSMRDSYKLGSNETDEANGQFGIQIKWLKENQNPIVDSKKFIGDTSRETPDLTSKMDREDTSSNWPTSDHDDQFYLPPEEQEPLDSTSPKLSSSSWRASITMAASRLTLENLQLNDTGHHTCQVDMPVNLANDVSASTASIVWFPHNNYKQDNVLVGRANGSLLVQEQPITDQSDGSTRLGQSGAYLWVFHNNGISVYKLQNDDGQEMELVREINGHSMVSGEVDGNWNQLTLCGGLNPEQVVICEWSDNAIRVEVQEQGSSNADVARDDSSKTNQRKYVYVGQPNLNRIVVLDGLRFEIVAIVNTEPQPRKLHLYKPNKVHLSKWVRRRLSPVANARWMAAIGTRAHSLKSTPADSRLYSNEPWRDSRKSDVLGHRHRQRQRRAYSSSTNQLPSALIQHDIWLLCYGQPLVVDPSGDESEEDAVSSSFYSTFETRDLNDNNTVPNGSKQPHKLTLNTVQPFAPRITPPLMLSVWPSANNNNNKESRIGNRKSVHIIQSTFFPQLRSALRSGIHDHNEDNQADAEEMSSQGGHLRNLSATTLVGEFKRSSVLTTHHIFSALGSSRADRMYLRRTGNGPSRHQFDPIQNLFVPPKPYSLELNDHHKIHYSYVTHYNERRLFRVNMDEYRYDQDIDLENCDPINLMTTAQGLLVVQCRAPKTHNLIGQLVLDELTNSRIEFNGNIRAQDSYLSPDNRYLISIQDNSTSYPTDGSQEQQPGRQRRSRVSATEQQDHLRRQASIIYVQLVTVSGLKLQYEIKTSLEVSQCSFVWKAGYYAAIFVSTNRRDQQSEILSLRLADSRLELMARVPGVVSRTKHKEQLIVSPELRLAALSTNQGTYVVDLEDNRVSQSLRHHQSPPTLLWV